MQRIEISWRWRIVRGLLSGLLAGWLGVAGASRADEPRVVADRRGIEEGRWIRQARETVYRRQALREGVSTRGNAARQIAQVNEDEGP